MLNCIALQQSADTVVDDVFQRLKQDGVVVLPSLLTRAQLDGMQRSFAARLKRLRWNHIEGFQKTELYRHMVYDILTLDQGFIDISLHPVVKGVLSRYIGPSFALVEAKGWQSVPTRRNFHGWHGDMWYDQEVHREIPREVKLAVYLTDVETGAFTYIKGSHGKRHPRLLRRREYPNAPASQVAHVLGSAGTAFLFDTTGIHRQSVPVLDRRQAVFLNYHDPSVPLMREDIDTYRYHPLILNAAYLGNLSEEDQRILGFGNKRNHIQAFEQSVDYTLFQSAGRAAYEVLLHLRFFQDRVMTKLSRLFAGSPRG